MTDRPAPGSPLSPSTPAPSRTHHRRARHADLSDHLLRLQRRRPRRLAVRTAGVRQHLYPHHQPDHRRARGARCGAGRRHRGARDRVRPRRPAGRVPDAAAARR
ncbi:MAG: hypothetical protein MZV49_02985 [Rhodopseudomonas palustris]|nr:hypothetical protein [Rhodopseudomonas palustris]